MDSSLNVVAMEADDKLGVETQNLVVHIGNGRESTADT
jgi:hypothetical protein